MHGMNWLLSDIAQVLDTSYRGEDVYVQRIITDSRHVQLGDVFVALVGERVDGHDFIHEVIAKGAVAVIVTRFTAGVDAPQLCVPDAVIALQNLAGAWRRKFTLSPCIVVTGSNGKTSVKEMFASVLNVLTDGHTLLTQGNLNNHLGVPMTLLSLRSLHQSAVVEIGANHVGEIACLVPLVQPNIAVITSIAMAHIGEFGSLERIMQAKGEIWSALTDKTDIAVVPIVSEMSPFNAWPVWQASLANKRVVAFGQLADVQVSRGWHAWVGVVDRKPTAGGQRVTLASSDWGSETIDLPILGAHQANNVAAVAAGLLAYGLSWQAIKTGLVQTILPGGRLRKVTLAPKFTVIDDTYNANPASMNAAIAVLMELPAKMHIFVMGMMGELGDDALSLHLQVVTAAKKAGVRAFYAMGKEADKLATQFGDGVAYDDATQLAQAVSAHYQEIGDVAVLVKGSRSSRMERVVEALIAMNNQENRAIVEGVAKV